MQGNLNSYKYITTAATTTFAGNETVKVVLGAICINKTLTGTLTIKADTTTIGVFAAGTLPGEYWHTTNGTEIDTLTIVNSATEDVVVLYRNI